MLKLVRSAGLCASKEETEQATTTKSTEALELGGEDMGLKGKVQHKKLLSRWDMDWWLPQKQQPWFEEVAWSTTANGEVNDLGFQTLISVCKSSEREP